MTKNHRVSGLNIRNAFSPSSGSPKSRCQQDWFLLWTMREGFLPSLSSWFVKVHLYVHMAFSLYGCLSPIAPFYEDNSHIRLEPPPRTIFTWLPLWSPYLQIKSHSEVLGLELQLRILGGHSPTPCPSQDHWSLLSVLWCVLTHSIGSPGIPDLTLRTKPEIRPGF